MSEYSCPQCGALEGQDHRSDCPIVRGTFLIDNEPDEGDERAAARKALGVCHEKLAALKSPADRNAVLAFLCTWWGYKP